MATTQQPAPFGGQPDYSQYASWPKVIAPDGTVYYKVPGTGYLLNPFLSAAKGRPVLFTDPTAKAAEVQDAKDAQKKAQKQQEQANSPTGQMLPVVGTVGGALLANEVMNLGFGEAPAKVIGVTPDGTTLFDDGSKILANGTKVPVGTPQAPTGGVPPVQSNIPGGITETNLPITQPQAAAQGATGGAPTTTVPQQVAAPAPTPVGSARNGGTLMSDGTTNSGLPQQGLPPGSTPQPDGTVTDSNGVTIGRYVQGAAGAYLFYSGVKQFQDGDKVGGGLTAASGVANMGAAYEGSAGGSFTDAGPYLSAALGAYHGYKGFTDENLTSTQQTQAGAKALGKGAADMFTFGLATPVIGALENSSLGKKIVPKIDKFDAKYNPVTIAVSKFGSSKGGDQLIRDQYRKKMIESGAKLFNNQYQGTLADGSNFDFGADGSHLSLKKLDFKDPTIGKAAAYGNVLATIQGASKEGDARRALATQFLAGSTSNANGDLNVVKANNAHFLQQIGVNDLATGQSKLDEAKKAGRITEDEFQVFSNDLKELYQPAPTKSNTPTATPAAPGFNVGTQPTQVQAAASGATNTVQPWMRAGRT